MGATPDRVTGPPAAAALSLGCAFEPDFLLMKLDQGRPRLLGGCVCFPSSWDLQEKIGREMSFIHEAVPGLNSALGNQISGFLAKIRPGVSWNRTNWGLSRSAELNQHPRRGIPRLDESTEIDGIFLRIEHQSLAALPESGGILFGIRIEVVPLRRVMEDERAARRLAEALRTMPEEVARYKGLAAVRDKTARRLEAATSRPCP
jgi:hypothetical protein